MSEIDTTNIKKVYLTQLPLETPDNYIDGNEDWIAARDFAMAKGWPARSVCQIINNFVFLLRDQTLDPYPLREDKEINARAMIGYVVKTLEEGFVLVADPTPHGEESLNLDINLGRFEDEQEEAQ